MFLFWKLSQVIPSLDFVTVKLRVTAKIFLHQTFVHLFIVPQFYSLLSRPLVFGPLDLNLRDQKVLWHWHLGFKQNDSIPIVRIHFLPASSPKTKHFCHHLNVHLPKNKFLRDGLLSTPESFCNIHRLPTSRPETEYFFHHLKFCLQKNKFWGDGSSPKHNSRIWRKSFGTEWISL